MDIKLSIKQKKVCTGYQLKPEELAFADLVAVGWSVQDAWAVAIRKGTVWDKKQLEKEQQLLADKVAVQNRIDDVRLVLRRNQIAKVEAGKEKEMKSDRAALLRQATSKEDMLIDLQQSIVGMQAGSKEWLDVKKLIVEVSRMKQDEIKEEDTTIHYYLPVNYPTSCKNCLLNKDKKD